MTPDSDADSDETEVPAGADPPALTAHVDSEGPGLAYLLSTSTENIVTDEPALSSVIASEMEATVDAVAMAEGNETLGSEIKRGATWSSLSSIAIRLGTFAMGIVAARLIAPEQFGVFTVALTVHAIILNISEIGVGAYLVRHDGPPEKVAPTVMSVSLVTSASLAGLMYLTAPFLAESLGSADASGPIRILALTVLLAGPSAVPNALLVRSFRQDRIFVSQVLSFLSSNSILVVLAIAGSGAYALAWSRVAGHLVQTIALIILAGRVVRPGLDRILLRRILRFGLPLAGSSLLGFATNNVDFIVVGRQLGSEPLGLFSLAYNVSSWGFGVLSPVIAAVAMPAFARVRHDRERLPVFMTTALQAVLFLALPLSALTIALSGPLIDSVYGGRWAGAAPALAIVALYGALRVPSDLFVNTTIAFGRTRALFVMQIVYFAALIPMMVIGVEAIGIEGAARAHAAGLALTFMPPMLWLICKCTGVRLRALFVAAMPPLAAATVAGSVSFGVTHVVDGTWLRLIAGGLAGVLVYAALLGPWLRRTVPAARDLWRDGGERSPADALATDSMGRNDGGQDD